MLGSQDKTVVNNKAIMSHENKNFINVFQEFLGSLVVRTQRFDCYGSGFDPLSQRTKIL